MTDLSSSAQPRATAADLFGSPCSDQRPSWFKQSSFLSSSFSPDAYISDLRSFVPLDTLRSELHALSASLKHQLVDLINRDYADFVSLSTRLTDVDAAVLRMRAPLLEIRDRIVGFRDAVEGSLVDLRRGMEQREEAAAAREVLQVLLDTFHVVSKVEKLIKELPTVPSDWPNGHANSAEKDHLSNGYSSQQTENGTNLRETQSMLLERIASEMNRLKFYITHAQNLPFIENMVKRIQNSSQLLDASLGHCFVDGLEHKDASAIYNCLRAYAATDNTKSAEDIFRLTVVAPLIQKIIPHSSAGVVGGSFGDALEDDYKQIKQYIETDCKFLLEISSTENSGLHVFSFLANSILKEVLSAIQKGKPGAFSPGRPTEFLKNYKSSLDFLAHLEGCCPTRSAVTKFRGEAVYIEFMKQWNVGVYFSLRFQEIAGALDSALTGASLVPVSTSHPDAKTLQGLALKQSITLLECLRSCWRDDIFVISCSDKFLRLSFQLISRYSSWLSAGLAAREAGNAGSNPGSEWAISAAPEDFVYVIHDLNSLGAEICDDFLKHVVLLFSSCATEVRDIVKQSILQGGKSLKDLVPLIMKAVVHILVEKSAKELVQLKGLSATYTVTNRPPPVRHSSYVSGVLRPLKAFLDGQRVSMYLTKEIKNEILQSAAVGITVRYHDLATELADASKKTELSLLKFRQGAQRRAGASSDVSDNYISNADKICMQLFLDIQEYARHLDALGVDAAKIDAYRSLWQCVAPSDRQNTISF